MGKQKKTKQPNVARRKRPVFACFKGIIRIFYKKPKIYYMEGKQPENSSVILANHCRKKGPMVYDMYLPTFTAKWGAGEMTGTYKERWHYLRDIFYMQKRGFSKFRASLLATFEAFFSKFIYKGLGVIGTFHDMRLKKTIKTSIDTLEKDTAILIFPENSDEGYFEQLTELHAGFTLLCDAYARKHGKDVPIYPIYFHERKNIILIDNPVYYGDFVKQGLSRKEIAEQIRLKINGLFHLVEQNQLPQQI